MTELIFLVQDIPEGGFTAQALGVSIFTQADTWDELQQQVCDAATCHFYEADKCKESLNEQFICDDVEWGLHGDS